MGLCTQERTVVCCEDSVQPALNYKGQLGPLQNSLEDYTPIFSFNNLFDLHLFKPSFWNPLLKSCPLISVFLTPHGVGCLGYFIEFQIRVLEYEVDFNFGVLFFYV